MRSYIRSVGDAGRPLPALKTPSGLRALGAAVVAAGRVAEQAVAGLAHAVAEDRHGPQRPGRAVAAAGAVADLARLSAGATEYGLRRASAGDVPAVVSPAQLERVGRIVAAWLAPR